VGRLSVAAPPNDPATDGALRDGLSELGYVEGRNIRFEYRSAEGHPERLAGLAEELVRLKVDVIVTGTDSATRAAKQATSTIPIVAVLPEDDPVAAGFIESFSHPGGNVTGLVGGARNSLLVGKRLALLKEILPGLSRVAVLWDPLVHAEVAQIKPAAHALGIEVQLVEMRTPYDFDHAFTIVKRQKAGAVMLLSTPQAYVRRFELGALALKRKVLVESPYHELTRAGGLMSYSKDVRDNFYRSAYYVDKVLKGVKPADLPFEQPANVKFLVNLKTADALGVKVPQTILLLADEVIQ
jgi:putative ABC transport system substrate-binding protein